MKRKKVAFCFSGQARTLELCYPYIKRYMLDPIGKQGIDYDVFCCSTNDEDRSKVELLNPTVLITRDNEEYNNDAVRQNYKTFFARGNINNHLNQLDSISLCNNIRKDYQKKNNISYDWIFRARYDVFPLKKIDYNELNKSILNIPGTKEKRFKSCNDVICISNDKKMNIYCNHYENFENVIETFYVDYNYPQKISFYIEKKYVSIFQFLENVFKEGNIINKFFNKLISFRENIFMRPGYESFYTLEASLYRHLEDKKTRFKELDIDYCLIRKDPRESGIELIHQDNNNE